MEVYKPAVFALFVYALPFILTPALLISAYLLFANARTAFTAPYYRLRTTAGRAAFNWLFALAGCAVGLIWAINTRGSVSPPNFSRLLEATSPAAGSSTLSPSDPGPGGATKDPFGLPPTITPTLPTPTASPTPFVVPVESKVTPLPGASFTITTIASRVSETFVPLDSGSEFAVGIQRIYVFFDYSNMTDGVSSTRALLLDGKVVRAESEAWKYNESGENAYYYFEASGGWPAGEYQVQFYIGTRLVAQAAFTIK